MKRLILISLALFATALISCEEAEPQNDNLGILPDDGSGGGSESNDSLISLPDTLGCTIDIYATTRNVVEDYGMQSSTTLDQSAKLQAALDDMESIGGGNLLIPEGTYCFSEVYMRSNVHLRVSEDATLRPVRSATGGSVIMLHFTPSNTEVDSSYLSNCSVSCYDGDQFTVDYSDFNPDETYNIDGSNIDNMIRFIRCRLVHKFRIEDVRILDNFTKYCGIIFVGADTDDEIVEAQNWPITGPVNGVISNCSTNNASHGYGLCQLHAADSLLFDNMRATGGVTLRLEGHTGNNVGVYNIYGRDISSTNGKCAVMFQPHVFHHGKVLIDGVRSEGSAFAVLIRPGFINNANIDNPDACKGTYDSDSHIDNIHAVYGINAQIEEKDLWIYETDQYEYVVNVERGNGCYQEEGPSYAPVLDNTEGNDTSEGQYDITCTNITYEGFPESLPESGIIYTEDLPRSQSDTWSICSNYGITAFD